MDPLSVSELKVVACDAIDAARDDLNMVSQEIWSHPEEKYEEHHAHQFLTDYLDKLGLSVERHYVTDTGFRATHGSAGRPNICVICEYDCLPEIGHACGHNLIAEIGVGAAIGIKAALSAAKTAGKDLGLLTVLGTPAEEEGGGKIDMIRAGTFDSVDLAMMSHPAPYTQAASSFTARDEVTVCYHGVASHAAASPWSGVNALDAAVMAYHNISVLRQQMKPDWKLHGIISNGGAKPNIIPEASMLEVYVRALTTGELATLKEKVQRCFQAAAHATGCTVEISWCDKPYDNTISNPTLTALYTANALSLGVEFSDHPGPGGGSTDMGNVGHVVPSIHPVYYVGQDVANHSRPFTAAAGLPGAQPHTLNQAKALAMCAIDVYCQPHLVDSMKTELREQLACEERVSL